MNRKSMKIVLAVVGIVMVGMGVAFNAAAALGNDPVGIVYDGIRNTAQLSAGQLGMASNIVNIVLMILVFCLDRHYVNIGTFIYVVPYGVAVDLGGRLYAALFPAQTTAFQIAGAALGCLLLYTGVALFIAADIGLDPFTGVVMVIRDKVKGQYRTVKIGFDICCIILGAVLGGKRPGDFMLITDHITTGVPSPLIGANADELGVRFPDMSEVYSLRMRGIIKQEAAKLGIGLREGVYVQLTGPAYETPAEVRMCRGWGGDAVGMSTACEAMAARHMGTEVCGLSCITNLAAGLSSVQLDHKEVQETADRVAGQFKALVTAVVSSI